MKKTTGVIILIVCLLAATAAWAINEYYIQTTGRYEGLIFNPVEINWENVVKDLPVDKTVTVTNAYSQDVTNLVITYEQISAPWTYIVESNYAENTPIPSGDDLPIIFTLTMTDGLIGEQFDFQIWIVAEFAT